MNHEMSTSESKPPAFWRSRYAIGLLVMGAIATYFLLSEHRVHFLNALPLLLLLSCPLMHVFMHHGHQHGGHEGPGGREGPGTDRPQGFDSSAKSSLPGMGDKS